MGRNMDKKRLQMLVSAVNKKALDLPGIMNIESDAIIVDQLIGDAGKEFECELSDQEEIIKGNTIRILRRCEKGVGLSRNTGLFNAESEIIQFADDDIIYDAGYSQRILEEFDAHPEADILLFNVKAQAGRETYWNKDYARISWMNYGRYPAYAICARRDKLIQAGVKYSLLFGGGAPYMNGEDSLFLHDCLKAGLSIYRTTAVLGHEQQNESTWFKGYTEKFFFDRGVLYHFLYGKMAFVWGFRFLLKNRAEMCSEYGLFKSYRILLSGVRHGRTIKTQ